MAIDPAFKAAPFLGESSQDPIEFSRRQKTLKNAAQMRKDKEIEQNTAKGLEKLMLDIKGWEDEKGFREVMDSYNKNISTFMDLSKRGLNLASPRTETEIMAFKKLNEEHEKTKQLLDTWNRNKEAVDLFNTMVKQDAAKPESERKLDYESSRVNLEKQLTGTIQQRNLNLENLLVFKPELDDVHKFVKDNMAFITKPDVVSTPEVDPTTGATINRTREVVTPEVAKAQETDLRKLYKSAPQPIKNAVKDQKSKDSDPSLKIMSDEDYFVSMYNPKFKEKMIDKATGSGGGLNISFLGTKTTMEPGRERKEPLNYGDKTFSGVYEFQTSKPLRIPLGASGSEIFMGKTWKPLTGGGDVEGTLAFYDAPTDKFIFRTTQAGAAPFVMNNMTVAVPRDVIGDQADDLPIEVGGQVKKLKDVFGAKQTVKKKLPVQWSQGLYTGSKNKTK